MGAPSNWRGKCIGQAWDEHCSICWSVGRSSRIQEEMLLRYLSAVSRRDRTRNKYIRTSIWFAAIRDKKDTGHSGSSTWWDRVTRPGLGLLWDWVKDRRVSGWPSRDKQYLEYRIEGFWRLRFVCPTLSPAGYGLESLIRIGIRVTVIKKSLTIF